MNTSPAVLVEQGRLKKGLKQTEAAEKLGIAQSTLCRIERGSQIPAAEVLKSMNELYGLGLSSQEVISLRLRWHREGDTSPLEKKLLKAIRRSDLNAATKTLSLLFGGL